MAMSSKSKSFIFTSIHSSFSRSKHTHQRKSSHPLFELYPFLPTYLLPRANYITFIPTIRHLIPIPSLPPSLPPFLPSLISLSTLPRPHITHQISHSSSPLPTNQVLGPQSLPFPFPKSPFPGRCIPIPSPSPIRSSTTHAASLPPTYIYRLEPASSLPSHRICTHPFSQPSRSSDLACAGAGVGSTERGTQRLQGAEDLQFFRRSEFLGGSW
jgi:hypothetical protein